MLSGAAVPGIRYAVAPSGQAQYAAAVPVVAGLGQPYGLQAGLRPRTPPPETYAPPANGVIPRHLGASFGSGVGTPGGGVVTTAGRSGTALPPHMLGAHRSPGQTTPPHTELPMQAPGLASVASEVNTRLSGMVMQNENRRALEEFRRTASADAGGVSVTMASSAAAARSLPQQFSSVQGGARPLGPATPMELQVASQTLGRALPSAATMPRQVGSRMVPSAPRSPVQSASHAEASQGLQAGHGRPQPPASPALSGAFSTNSTGGQALSVANSFAANTVATGAASGAGGGEAPGSSSLEQLIARLTVSLARREQALKEQEQEKRQIEELLSQSKAEFGDLSGAAERLQRIMQGNAADRALSPPPQGPERPRCRRRPPFAWQPSPDYEKEFQISGESGEIVTKLNDFEDKGWVIPVGGTLRLARGGVYRWTMCIERKCPHRPQLQIGIHGVGHRRPWRLLTTSRCSRARDDDPWHDRPGGDRMIDEGDFVHLEVDLRGLHLPFGTMSMAINAEPPELVFDDIPLNTSTPIMPVVSTGGDQSRVRLCSAY